MVEKDDVIPLRWPVRTADGKRVLHKIPVTKGQVIHIPSRTVNRLSCVWGPDADQFDPARWLDPARMPASGDLTNGWAGIFSFSEGPRTCVGYRLGECCSCCGSEPRTNVMFPPDATQRSSRSRYSSLPSSGASC